MAGTRRATRKPSGPAAKGTQSTLAFTNNKVTKTTHVPGKPPISTSSQVKKVEEVEAAAKSEIKSARKGELADNKLPAVAVAKFKTEEEERASKITDLQIKKYWREREAERKAPRVHQGDVSVEEKILRLFDMSVQYGPAIGSARQKRWYRANNLGLNPPIEVLAVLIKEQERGNAKIERAHVDELMSSKFAVGEA